MSLNRTEEEEKYPDQSNQKSEYYTLDGRLTRPIAKNITDKDSTQNILKFLSGRELGRFAQLNRASHSLVMKHQIKNKNGKKLVTFGELTEALKVYETKEALRKLRLAKEESATVLLKQLLIQGLIYFMHVHEDINRRNPRSEINTLLAIAEFTYALLAALLAASHYLNLIGNEFNNADANNTKIIKISRAKQRLANSFIKNNLNGENLAAAFNEINDKQPKSFCTIL